MSTHAPETDRATSEAANDNNTTARALRSPLPIVHYRDIKPILNSSYLVKGWLYENQTSVLVGNPGDGKSTLAAGLAVHVAHGRRWFGQRVPRAGVIYIAGEDETGVQNRIAAVRQDLKLTGDAPLAVVTQCVALAGAVPDTNKLLTAIDSAQEQWGGVRVGLIIVDTLATALDGGDDSDAETMGSVIKQCKAIQRATGAHVMLVHHGTKAGGVGKGGRGHSSLWGHVHTEIDIERDAGGKIRTVTLSKQRNGPEGLNLAFSLRSVVLGTDADRDPVTAAVCVQEEVIRRRRKLTERERAVRDAVLKAIKDHGKPMPASERFGDGNVTAVTDTVARDYADKALQIDNPDSKRKAVTRALEALRKKGALGYWDQWYWMINE